MNTLLAPDWRLRSTVLLVYSSLFLRRAPLMGCCGPVATTGATIFSLASSRRTGKRETSAPLGTVLPASPHPVFLKGQQAGSWLPAAEGDQQGNCGLGDICTANFAYLIPCFAWEIAQHALHGWAAPQVLVVVVADPFSVSLLHLIVSFLTGGL